MPQAHQSVIHKHVWRAGSFILASVLLCQDALGGENTITRKDLKDLDCMISVVRAAPYTKDAKIGLRTSDNLPFIAWHYDGPDGGPADIEFDGGGQTLDSRKWTYTAVFGNGVMPINEPNFKPPHWGADKIATAWRKRCGIEAGILSF